MDFSGITKTLLVMKLTALILVIGCLQVTAKGFSQESISISKKDAPLEEVLTEISRQSGYKYFFADKLEEQARKVTIEVSNASLDEVLKICFLNQPFTYAIVRKLIVIKQKKIEESKNPPPTLLPRIAGVVNNDKNEPLVGATVSIKNTHRGTSTNEKGEFELRNIPFDAIIEISYSGYQTKDFPLNGQTSLILILPISNSPLDQVQVIAYGTTNQRFNTGDVTTVTSKEIDEQPVSNPLLALEGRVPGLFITQSSGVSGSGITVQIQGQNSIANGNDPFYIVDGVPFSSQLLPNYGNVLGYANTGNYNSTAGSPFTYINPSDIESISVLKDADATAIYGSRAANGAILITTKRGKLGQTKVDFNLQNGRGQIARKLNLLNTPEYLEMRHEANNNNGNSTQLSDYDINGFWDTTRNSNWQKELIGNTAIYTNLNATVSGGTSTMQYLIGGTYRRETSVFPGDFADQKGSTHFNISSSSVNQKFRTQLSGEYLVDNNQLPATDLTSSAITLAPDAPRLYNKDGSLNWMPDNTGYSTFYNNPLAYTLQTYSNKTSSLIGNLSLSYQILPGLDIKSSFGYTNLQTNEDFLTPLTYWAPESRPHNQRQGIFADNNIKTWIIEPQIIYNKIISKGKFDFLIGSTIQQNKNNSLQLVGKGYNNDAAIADIHSANNVTVNATIASVYKYNGLFGRLGYIWDEKYLFDFTARRDGSSRFGSANQFHNFGAVGSGWIFSKESFLVGASKILSYGKLRGSYGVTGNDQIGDYSFLALYNPTYSGVPYQGVTGLQPNGLTNPYLQWEVTKKLAIGADLGFFKDRILVSAIYFKNRSSNQLLQYNLSVLTGYTSIAKNFPATVQNSGLEFTLNTTNIKTNNFVWSSHFNLTIPANKLVSFPGLATSSYANSLIIGKPISIVKLFHLIGVNDTTGTYQFSTKQGPTYNPSYTDNTIIVSKAATYYGGFDNNFRYKGLYLDFTFQFVKQKGSNYYFGEAPGYPFYNQPRNVLNRWQKPGEIKPIQQFDANFTYGNQWGDAISSDAGFSDASYVRLKNLSLAYEFSGSWIHKAGLQSARVYVQGQNLLTITHYLGMDPENLSTASLPPLRVLTMGIQVAL